VRTGEARKAIALCDTQQLENLKSEILNRRVPKVGWN
jgi:hypothetical protein